MENTEPVLDKVKRLFIACSEVNDKVRYLNYGGCGIFAEQFYYALSKLGIEAEIVIATENPKWIENRLNFDWSGECACIDHILVRVEGRLIDSQGIYHDLGDTIFNYCDLTEPIPVHRIKTVNDSTIGWNSCFDRTQIPMVEQIVNEAYEKVK